MKYDNSILIYKVVIALELLSAMGVYRYIYQERLRIHSKIVMIFDVGQVPYCTGTMHKNLISSNGIAKYSL